MDKQYFEYKFKVPNSDFVRQVQQAGLSVRVNLSDVIAYQVAGFITAMQDVQPATGVVAEAWIPAVLQAVDRVGLPALETMQNIYENGANPAD